MRELAAEMLARCTPQLGVLTHGDSQLVRQLFLLPDLAAAVALRGRAHLDTSARASLQALTADAVACAVLRALFRQSTSPMTHAAAAAAAAQAALVGQAKTAAQELIALPTQLAVEIMGQPAAQRSENLLCALVGALAAHSPPDGTLLCALLLASSAAGADEKSLLGYHLLTHKLVRTPVVLAGGKRALPILAAAWKVDHTAGGSALLDALRHATRIWSSEAHLRHSDLSIHSYVTASLHQALQTLGEIYGQDARRVLDENRISTELLAGVSAHMNSPIVQTRHLGMRTAEILSVLIDPQNPLRLLPQEGDTSDSEDDDDPDVKTQPTKSEDWKEQSADQSDSDTDSLAAFDLTDEDHGADKRKDQAPRHLRHCLPVLVKPPEDNIPLFENVLHAVPELVRARPPDLPNVAVALATRLLHLSNQYNLPRFAFFRFEGLIALCVTATDLVAPYLVTQFSQRNYSISHRLDILRVLEQSATELAHGKRKTDEAAQPPKPTLVQEILHSDAAGEEKSQLVQARLEQKTRRWGVTKHAPTTVNRFLPYGPLFFYGLLHDFGKTPSAIFEIAGDDALVVGSLLRCVGTLLESTLTGHAQPSEHTPRIALSLLQFSLQKPLAAHKNAFVRQGCLFALSRVFISLPTDTLSVVLADELSEIHDFLEKTALQDSNSECQQLARANMSLLLRHLQPKTLVQESQNYLF
eukprot:TRINITY_DN5435_c0_g1_i1.p1 TRINITY_DN5435_c0_g1~~TRINITY_DN5435_c0_g1_i1.p1  ORF type:complete len:753 (+),score=174.04 TRINITY_DN5435_c0_g1_i1:163-2259(+)